MSIVIVFIFGASIGSFVQLIANRLHVAPIVRGRSKCLSCGEALRISHLIPVLSNLYSRGMCLMCKCFYGYSSAIFEFLSGLYFVLVYILIVLPQTSLIAQLVYSLYYLLLFVALGVIVLYDIAHTIVPKRFLIVFLFLSLCMLGYRYSLAPSLLLLLDPFVVAFPFGFLYLMSSLFARRVWLGFGDVLMFLGVGAFFGIAQGFVVFMVSVWMGAIWGVVLFAARRFKNTKDLMIPFVPFIVLGFLVVLFTDIDIMSIANVFTR